MPQARIEPSTPVLLQYKTVFTLDRTTRVVCGIVPVGLKREAPSGRSLYRAMTVERRGTQGQFNSSHETVT